jgi:hypothetical protein
VKSTRPLTHADARARIRALGMTVSMTEHREFRVNFPYKAGKCHSGYCSKDIEDHTQRELRDCQESTAYYTNDAEDAVDTALAMKSADTARRG